MSAALKTVDDLTPEALAFIKKGTPTPQVERPVVALPKEAASPKSAPASEGSAPENVAETPKIPRTKISVQKEEVPAVVGVVGLSFRLPIELHHALMRASSDRKIKRQQPWTQQEIAAEALSVWLKKGGYN